MRKMTLFFSLCFLYGCDKNPDTDTGGKIKVDLEEFQPINEHYPYSNLAIEGDVNYYELILEFPAYEEMDHSILVRSGELCPFAENKEQCKTDFEALIGEYGFMQGCIGICESFYYIRFQENSENLLILTKNELKEFLGPIDHREDAILWAKVNGYDFSINDVANGGTKKIADGYELLMTRIVEVCLPVQTNRYHLRMQTDGNIQILGEEVLLVEENICI